MRPKILREFIRDKNKKPAKKIFKQLIIIKVNTNSFMQNFSMKEFLDRKKI